MRDEGPAKKRVKAIVCEARGAAERQAVRDAGGEAASAARATNLQSLYIPAKLRRVDGEGNFLFYDEEAGSDKSLISGTQPSVAFLRHSPNWSADSTFRIPPRIWQRMYSLRASESGLHMRCLCDLAPEKKNGRNAVSGWPRWAFLGTDNPPPQTCSRTLSPARTIRRNDCIPDGPCAAVTSTLARQ